MAQVPVSTPGNELMWGLETDVAAGYRNTAEGFYGGFTWGILWPLGALNRNFPLYPHSEDASVAQILRIYMPSLFLTCTWRSACAISGDLRVGS